MNQKIPAATDMQPLGELKDGGIPLTSISETIEWAEFSDSSLNTTSIDVATGFVKTSILNYYHDQIGSVRLVTEFDNTTQSIKVVWNADYTPYGDILNEDFQLTWLPLKTWALHEHDIETGLIYAQQRWYDPETADFTSEDGAQDGLNWYAYCGGDPLGAVDPTGLSGGYEPGNPKTYDRTGGGYSKSGNSSSSNTKNNDEALKKAAADALRKMAIDSLKKKIDTKEKQIKDRIKKIHFIKRLIMLMNLFWIL
jgi:RHS repeat-associated protein